MWHTNIGVISAFSFRLATKGNRLPSNEHICTHAQIWKALHDLKFWDDVIDLRLRLPGERMCISDSLLRKVKTILEPEPPSAERKFVGSISRGKFRHFLIQLAQREHVEIIFDRQTLGFECVDNAPNTVSVLMANSSGARYRC